MRNLNKKTITSFAVFEPAIEGGYNVSFPAFPGCVTFGKTFEEAQTAARDLLPLWIKELKSRKDTIPSYFVRPIVDTIEVSLVN